MAYPQRGGRELSPSMISISIKEMLAKRLKLDRFLAWLLFLSLALSESALRPFGLLPLCLFFLRFSIQECAFLSQLRFLGAASLYLSRTKVAFLSDSDRKKATFCCPQCISKEIKSTDSLYAKEDSCRLYRGVI